MYITIKTIDDNYTKTVCPKLFTDAEAADRELFEFIVDNIIDQEDDKEIADAVDEIINDDCHNLLTTDSYKLAEMVYDEIDSKTDKVIVGETALCENGSIYKSIRYTNDGYAEFVIYKVGE